MKVKICGLTNLQDALIAVECGADAIGFVCYPPSPRYIHPLDVAYILDRLPPFVVSVGVFAQSSFQEIAKDIQESKVQLVQLHHEGLFVGEYDRQILKVKRIRNQADILSIPTFEYCLCDAFCDEFGGIGKRIRLDWFKGVNCTKIILAGGVNADNIHELKPFGFYGIDVSSGVERGVGKKDRREIERLIRYAKDL